MLDYRQSQYKFKKRWVERNKLLKNGFFYSLVKSQNIMYQSFKDMPIFLKFITAHALVMFMLFVATVVPGIPITFNGEVMESQELWAKSVGVFTALVGLMLPVCGILILKRLPYARHVYVLVISLVLVAPYVYWQELIGVAFGIVLITAVTIYLYKNGGVRAYFSS